MKVNKDKEALLTQEYLKSILEYNPETGDFIWINLAKNIHNIHIGDIAGTLDTRTQYIHITINNKVYQAHRLIWLYMTGNWPLYIIDHIDGIRIPNPNKWSNLRDTDKNNWNRGDNKNNTTGYKGVYLRKNGKYRSIIRVYNKNIHLGTFDTPEEASLAYEEAKMIYHKID